MKILKYTCDILSSFTIWAIFLCGFGMIQVSNGMYCSILRLIVPPQNIFCLFFYYLFKTIVKYNLIWRGNVI
jgi:hypothetical protein